jgi:hypothetical protein
VASTIFLASLIRDPGGASIKKAAGARWVTVLFSPDETASFDGDGMLSFERFSAFLAGPDLRV